ncbi:CPBP family intramembrane metalloprotease [Eubacteriales bacterium OttesenSCG-928-N13]|nr:CPBP family intramembrane metalloprotease [Eubacteriales bacterium OttesenSCG-928-N13]
MQTNEIDHRQDDALVKREQRKTVRRLVSKQARLVFFIYIVMSLIAAFFLSANIDSTEPQTINGSSISAIAACIGLVVAIFSRGYQRLNRDLRYKNGSMDVASFLRILTLLLGLQVFAGIANIGIEALLNAYGRTMIMPYFSTPLKTPMEFAYIVLIAPITEEIVFRGAIMHSLKPVGRWFAILMTSIMFALMHTTMQQLVPIFLCGLLLAVVAMNYSIKWSIVLHMLNNLYSTLFRQWSQQDAILLFTLLMALIQLVCLISSIVWVIKRRHSIVGYIKLHSSPPKSFRWAFSSAWMLILVATTLLFIGLGITTLPAS